MTTQDLEGDPFYEVNGAVRGRIAKVSLRDGREITAVNLFVLADSTSWYDRREERTFSVPTASVERVTVLRTGRAALAGLGAGLILGAALGAYRAVHEGDDDLTTGDDLALTQGEKLNVFPVAHAAYAAFVTTPLAALIGSRDVFRFEVTPRR